MKNKIRKTSSDGANLASAEISPSIPYKLARANTAAVTYTYKKATS